MPDLQHLVQHRLDELSREEGRRVTPRQAAKIPGAPSYETIRKIVQGKHSGTLTEHVVAGLEALGISRPSILRATNQTRIADLPRWTPPMVAHRLSLAQRRVVEAVIFALTDDREATGPHEKEILPIHTDLPADVTALVDDVTARQGDIERIVAKVLLEMAAEHRRTGR